MSGIKNFIKTVKELWKIPKYKGIMQVLFWLLFFVFVFFVIKVGDNRKNSLNISNTIEDKSLDSYEFNYQYNKDNNKIDIEGIFFKEKEDFYIGNNRYYYVDNAYYNAANNSIIDNVYPMNEWRYSNIKNIIDNNKYITKLEYTDGSVKYEYNIDYLSYNKYYNSNYLNNITITVLENEDYITNVTLNYGDIYVDIVYKNFNNIKNLDINID